MAKPRRVGRRLLVRQPRDIIGTPKRRWHRAVRQARVGARVWKIPFTIWSHHTIIRGQLFIEYHVSHESFPMPTGWRALMTVDPQGTQTWV